MIKNSICKILIIGLVITTLLGYDSVVSNISYAENTEANITESAIEEISKGAIEENKAGEPVLKTEQDATAKNKQTETKKSISEETTTPAPIRDTTLVTNPYKGYSYTRLIKEINALQAKYPEIIQTEYIGKTVSGRQIPLVKLGTGERKILIMGSEHAREYVTTNLIMRSIDTYSQAYIQNKKIDKTSVKNVLDNVTFYFVPMVNIDGVQLVLGTSTSKDKNTAKKYVGKKHYNKNKNRWKANVRGVDLNRNYPFRWSKGRSSKKRSYMSFKGKKQASEPEVKAIVNLCSNNQFAFMFTMHSRGQVVYWKDKYSGVVPGASTLINKVKSITGYRKMPTSRWSTCTGESAKWFRAVYNKPAFTIELTPSYAAYKKAPKNFDKYVWKKNKSLFLRTALTTSPTDKYKVFLSAGKGKVSKRYINITTGRSYGTLPKAKRKKYKFLGWYNSAGEKITSNTIAVQTKNITIYAKYKKK